MKTREIKQVGSITIENHILPVYDDLDKPLFKATDVCELIEYSYGNTWRLTQMCEKDEVLKLQIVVAGQKRDCLFITELGLYNVLSQSSKTAARKWRRVVHEQLIDLRRGKNFTIEDQFDEWNSLIDDIYFDEETGMLMQSVTVPGGDVEQVPYIPQ